MSLRPCLDAFMPFVRITKPKSWTSQNSLTMVRDSTTGYHKVLHLLLCYPSTLSDLLPVCPLGTRSLMRWALRSLWTWSKEEIMVCVEGSWPSEKERSWYYSILRVFPKVSKVMLWNDLSDPEVSFALETEVCSHTFRTSTSFGFCRLNLLSYSTCLFHFLWNKC